MDLSTEDVGPFAMDEQRVVIPCHDILKEGSWFWARAQQGVRPSTKGRTTLRGCQQSDGEGREELHLWR